MDNMFSQVSSAVSGAMAPDGDGIYYNLITGRTEWTCNFNAGELSGILRKIRRVLRF